MKITMTPRIHQLHRTFLLGILVSFAVATEQEGSSFAAPSVDSRREYGGITSDGRHMSSLRSKEEHSAEDETTPKELSSLFSFSLSNEKSLGGRELKKNKEVEELFDEVEDEIKDLDKKEEKKLKKKLKKVIKELSKKDPKEDKVDKAIEKFLDELDDLLDDEDISQEEYDIIKELFLIAIGRGESTSVTSSTTTGSTTSAGIVYGGCPCQVTGAPTVTDCCVYNAAPPFEPPQGGIVHYGGFAVTKSDGSEFFLEGVPGDTFQCSENGVDVIPFVSEDDAIACFGLSIFATCAFETVASPVFWQPNKDACGA